MKTSFVKPLLRTLVTLAAVTAVGSASASFAILPGTRPSNPLMPTTSAGNVFSFTFNVVGNERWYIDPIIAVGYDYAVAGATSPSFQSVLLPTVAGSHYQLWNMSSGSAVSLGALDAGTVLDFGAGGASAFRVIGIAESAMLDPSNTLAFVTGLTFTSAGTVNMTQTAITASVPEPSSYALMLLGVAGLGLVKRRRSAAVR